MTRKTPAISTQWLFIASALLCWSTAGCQQRQAQFPIFGSAHRTIELTQESPINETFGLTLLGFDQHGNAILFEPNALVVDSLGYKDPPLRYEHRTYALGLNESVADPPRLTIRVTELDQHHRSVKLSVLYSIEIQR